MIRSQDLGDGIRLLTIARPEKLNALTRHLMEELRDELRRARIDASVAGLVLTGAGPSFSAGVDLQEFAEGNVESGERMIQTLRLLCSAARNHPKPIACAISGQCLGGALELAACCDFRVVTAGSRLGMPEVFLGIPSVIDAVMLERHVGAGRARQLLLTGEPVDGETAVAWGLANRLAEPEAVVEAAAELVRLATRHDPAVIAAQKKLHDEWLDLPYEAAVERSVQPLLDAFREGRPQKIAAERLEARRRAKASSKP